MATADELYQKFLDNFPNFKPMVKKYYRQSDTRLKIYTKQGKKFIFELTEDGINLMPA